MEKEKQKQRELLNLVNKAKRAAEAAAKLSDAKAAAEVCRCVASLKELRCFPVNKEVMASTQADIVLRHLKIHNKDRIRLMAKWLFETWRPLIKDRVTDHMGITSSTKSTNQESLRKKRAFENHSVFPVKKPKMGCFRNLEQEEEQRAFSCFKKPVTEHKDDDVSIECSDACRKKIRENLLEGLLKVSGEVADCGDEEIKERVKACDPVRVSVSVESVMFKKMGPFNGAKKLQYRSITFNVRDAKNPDFRRKMLLGEIKPESLVSISTEEMASHERQREINQFKEKAIGKIHEPVAEEPVKKSDE